MSLVGELGERKIIEIILGCLDQMPNMPIPFGDDVSAVDIGDEKLAVIKTDMLVGKTDVPPGMNLWQAARKAVVMNVSDLAAKGVKPYALLASIGIPRTFTEKDIHQIGEGLNAGAREYNTYVLGGDTNEASDLVISCTAFGIVEKHFLMKRNGAKPNDLLAVTGFFGKSSSGLQILLEALKAPVHIKEKLVNTVLMPKARLKEGLALAQTQAVTASIDSSDGLAWSLHEISRASNVGFVIDNLPIAYEVEEFAGFSSLNPIELSLYGGEEYELVVAIKPKRWEKAKEATEHVGTPLIKIGQITKEKSFLLRVKEKTIHVKPKGWEHLRTT